MHAFYVMPQEQSNFYHNHLEDRWTQIYRIQIIVLILVTCYQKKTFTRQQKISMGLFILNKNLFNQIVRSHITK